MEPASAACRIAVVGAGPLVGVHHCAALAALQAKDSGVELACVCQRRPEDTDTAGRFGVAQYVDVWEMARQERLDGVVVATPTHLHLPVVESCIAAAQARQAALGEPTLALKAVLVEKPVCGDLASALRLVELAERAGVAVLVGHQRRHSALVQRARELVTHMNFGPLRGVSAEWALLKPESYFSQDNAKLAWRGQKGKGGPVLINLIHDVDLLRFLTGHEVVNVFAAMSTAARANEVEDTGAVTVVLDHGAVGTFLFSDAAPSPWNYEFSTGENKKYPPVPGGDPKDCYHFMGAQRSLAFPSLRQYRYDASGGREPGWDTPLTLEEHEVQNQDPIRVQMAHFVEVCRGKEEPICSGRDAMETLAVILAVLRSAETGAPVAPADLFKEAREGEYKLNGNPADKPLDPCSRNKSQVPTTCASSLSSDNGGDSAEEQATCVVS